MATCAEGTELCIINRLARQSPLGFEKAFKPRLLYIYIDLASSQYVG